MERRTLEATSNRLDTRSPVFTVLDHRSLFLFKGDVYHFIACIFFCSPPPPLHQPETKNRCKTTAAAIASSVFFFYYSFGLNQILKRARIIFRTSSSVASANLSSIVRAIMIEVVFAISSEKKKIRRTTIWRGEYHHYTSVTWTRLLLRVAKRFGFRSECTVSRGDTCVRFARVTKKKRSRTRTPCSPGPHYKSSRWPEFELGPVSLPDTFESGVFSWPSGVPRKTHNSDSEHLN
jgi:hypothetical protein